MATLETPVSYRCRWVIARCPSQQGFTLLEVVVALVVSAIIGLMAFQALDGASRGAERTTQVLDEVNDLDRTWQLIGNDLRHVVQPGGNTVFQGESLKSSGENTTQVILRLKRRGWTNFSNMPRSDLQLVSYHLAEGKLWRGFMPDFNRPATEINIEEEGFQQRLLEGVEDVQLRFLHKGLLGMAGKRVLEGEKYSDDWLPTWPDTSNVSATGLPIAVEISIELTGVGTSVRLFALPEPATSQKQ